MNNILIIGAHYDDTELGAGGTAAKLVSEGKKVYKLTLTDNSTQFTQRNIMIDANESLRDSMNACRILGVEEIQFEPLVCNELEYSKETMQRIEAIIYDMHIDTVFIHNQEDMNYDHVVASRLSMTAARHCDNILTYQSNVYQLSKIFEPRIFIDISHFIDVKREALFQYSYGHNRYNKLFEANIERNYIWGYANEVEYAEGFGVIKYLVR